MLSWLADSVRVDPMQALPLTPGDGDTRSALDLGVHDYSTKSIAMVELTARVYMRRARQDLEDDAAEPGYLQTEAGVGYCFARGAS